MSEAEQAWALWHLLELLQDALWQHYESAFNDYCGEEQCDCGYCPPFTTSNDTELPF